MEKHKFKKALLGYNAKEVETYIEKLEKNIVRSENLVLDLDKKIKEKDHLIYELQSQIELYRSKESSISKVMLHAQRVAEDLIKEGREKALRIQEELTEYSSAVSSTIVQTEEKVDLFYEDYRNLLQRYLIPLEQQETFSLLNKLENIKETVEELKTSVKNN